MSVSSSSWGLGRAAVCDCGTPWTFLLPFLLKKDTKFVWSDECERAFKELKSRLTKAPILRYPELMVAEAAIGQAQDLRAVHRTCNLSAGMS